jgi:hypothetical protein
MCWVLSATYKYNPLAQTYEPEVNLFHELWYTEEYPDAE